MIDNPIGHNLIKMIVSILVALFISSALGQQWLPTGSLIQPRTSHTATMMLNGKILVTGGIYQGTAVNVVEIYDSSSGNWDIGPNMDPRSQHVAVLLNNGDVLITGGILIDGTIEFTTRIYNPVSNSWAYEGALGNPRYGHTLNVLSNGNVLCAGGRNTAILNSVEIYSIQTTLWTSTGSLLKARYSHTATTMPDGGILVVGGRDGSGALSNVELFVPSGNTGSWIAMSSMPSGRYDHTATLLYDGRVLIAGGIDIFAPTSVVFIYSQTNNQWTTSSMLVARIGHTATELPDGNVVIIGGSSQTTEVYNPITGTWTFGVSLPTYQSDHSAVRISNNIVIIGGTDASGTSTSMCRIYDPTPSPTDLVPSPSPTGLENPDEIDVVAIVILVIICVVVLCSLIALIYCFTIHRCRQTSKDETSPLIGTDV